MSSLFLTGVTGFIGSYFVEHVHHDLRVSIRNNQSNVFKDVWAINGIDSRTNWDGAFENISFIVHLAGLAHSNKITREEYLEVNTYGTLHLANEAARAGVKRFVFMSTIGVNGAAVFIPLSSVCSNRERIEGNHELGMVLLDGKVHYRLADAIDIVITSVNQETRNIVAKPKHVLADPS